MRRASPARSRRCGARPQTAGASSGRSHAPGRGYRPSPSSRRVWCLPVEWHWSDVGTWASLAEELGVNGAASRVLEGSAWLCDAPGNLVLAHDRPIVLLGVEGLAVIDAGDALLVTKLEKSGAVRDVVVRLRKDGRSDLL
jgi:mannose-1-phosphate guanylyltransferase